MKPKCNQPYFLNDYQTLYCGREQNHKGKHYAGIEFK